MRKIIILLIVCIIIGVGFFSGCEENNPEHSMVGTWTNRETKAQFIFNKDNTLVIIAATNASLEGTYTINSSIISMSWTNGEIVTSFEWNYKFLSDNTLQANFSDPFSGLEQSIILDRT